MQKNGKFQGGHGKFDWKSKGVKLKKKIDILNRGGGVQFLSGRAHYPNVAFLILLHISFQ